MNCNIEEEVVKEDMGDDEVLGIFAAKDSGKMDTQQFLCRCCWIRRVVKCNWMPEPQCLFYVRFCM